MKNKVALSLPSHLQSWVEAQATVNGFSSAGEYIEHMLIEKRRAAAKDRIERQLLVALENNEYFELTKGHFRSLDKKLKNLVAR